MKQQIIVSGMGGQGVLFLTRIIAEAGLNLGLEVFTSETHGMAQRGGSVISAIKIGGFHSPMLGRGQAEAGIFLHPDNLPVHGHLLKPGAPCLVNAPQCDQGLALDATSLATTLGAPVLANLILLGFGAGKEFFFCRADDFRTVIAAISGERGTINLKAFDEGLSRA